MTDKNDKGLYRALPVFIRKENEQILKSSSEQNIHQISLNQSQRLNASTSSLNTSSRTQDDNSFTSLYSEDSDTTRIYDLKAQETKIVIPSNSSPEIKVFGFKKHSDIEVPIEPKKILRPVKPLSPDIIEFYSPKKSPVKPVLARRKMEEIRAESVENIIVNGDLIEAKEDVQEVQEIVEIPKTENVEINHNEGEVVENHEEKIVEKVNGEEDVKYRKLEKVVS